MGYINLEISDEDWERCELAAIQDGYTRTTAIDWLQKRFTVLLWEIREVERARWSYGPGPGTLAGDDDL